MKKTLDPDDAPPLTGKELTRPDIKWRIGSKEVSAGEGKAAFRAALRRKTRVNIHLDNDVIAHYKAEARGRGYQTLINAALRRDMEGSNLIEELKASVREEMGSLVTRLKSSFATLGTAVLISGSKYEFPEDEPHMRATTGTSGAEFKFHSFGRFHA